MQLPRNCPSRLPQGRDGRDGQHGRDGQIPGTQRPQGPKGEPGLVQQVGSQNVKASQELGEQPDHKDLWDQLDQGMEG